MRHAHVKADLLFFQVAHHAAGGVQPERAAARQHDGMHFFHHVDGVEQVGFTGAGRGAAHIHAANRARFGNDDRAAGGAARVGVVPHAQARNLGDAAAPGHQPRAIGLGGHAASQCRRARGGGHEGPPVPLLFQTHLPLLAVYLKFTCDLAVTTRTASCRSGTC
ncbi:hypothetical protein D3C72_1652080 [compost metagenome]